MMCRMLVGVGGWFGVFAALSFQGRKIGFWAEKGRKWAKRAVLSSRKMISREQKTVFREQKAASGEPKTAFREQEMAPCELPGISREPGAVSVEQPAASGEPGIASGEQRDVFRERKTGGRPDGGETGGWSTRLACCLRRPASNPGVRELPASWGIDWGAQAASLLFPAASRKPLARESGGVVCVDAFVRRSVRGWQPRTAGWQPALPIATGRVALLFAPETTGRLSDESSPLPTFPDVLASTVCMGAQPTRTAAPASRIVL
jgi:hypothetical protein